MQIKEFTKLKINKRKSSSRIQTNTIFKNKDLSKLFIIGSMIIACSSIYQTGTKAQPQPDITIQGEPTVLTDKGSLQIISGNNISENVNLEVNSNVPSIYPVKGRISDAFGSRASPFGKKSMEFHRGLDIAAPKGTPVNAAGDGRVIFAGKLSGYGNVVVIDHGKGLTTRYGHLSQINTLLGQPVRCGDIIGRVGSTGRSTGAHLHYEVRVDNQAVDPVRYLPLNQ